MIHTNHLLRYLDELLQPQRWSDYCPNGLQVAGCDQIKRLITGVTACQALLDQAVKLAADAILVHHGYFWRGENPCITGIKRARLATLLANNINLIAYHLPLDGHLEYGNNIQLASLLNIIPTVDDPNSFIFKGELTQPLTGAEFSVLIEQHLQRAPLHIPGKSSHIKSIAWCTGAGQDFINEAIAYKMDAYLTGEVSERVVHIAREAGIHFFAAGHHATERYGVKALGEHLAQKFDLIHQYIEIDNPV